MNVFYGDLAAWWPVLSPVEDYRDEAAEFVRALRARRPSARHLLELGSGGGHLAFHLKAHFACTLTDLSPQMLAMSAGLNPECQHLAGDMRALDVGRTFDVVLAHDAIGYMASEADLRAVFATARRHLTAGGLALFVPDDTLESFAPATECGGSDGPDGRAARITEWSEAVQPDGTAVVHYGFLLREADGTTRTAYERHRLGVFSEATWVRLLEQAGFTVEVAEERTEDEREPRRLFFATLRDGP